MEKNQPKKFKVGQLVLIKVRGHVIWPGQITNVTNTDESGTKYDVLFFGTNEPGTCNVEELSRYTGDKDSLSKTCRTKYYLKAIKEVTEKFDQIPEPVSDEDDLIEDNITIDPPSKHSTDVLPETDKKITVTRKTQHKTVAKTNKGSHKLGTVSAKDSQVTQDKRGKTSRSGRQIKIKKLHDV